MRRTTSCATLAMAALFTFAAAIPAGAAPPGFERWVLPDAESNAVLEVPVYADYPGIYQDGYYGKLIGTDGFRPVDLEINWYDKDPSVKDMLKDDPPQWYEISVVEVPNEDPLEAEIWGMELDTPGPDSDIFWLAQDNPTRMIDIELYFRKDAHDGTVHAAYAGIWVGNEGDDSSAWGWIPATPYDIFMDKLESRKSSWRPYDIEFALDPQGNVWGTALLAPVSYFQPIGVGDFEEYVEVDTKWEYFYPADLPGLNDDGWQLLDVEVPPDFQDPLATSAFDGDGEVVRLFGIFVRVPWLFDPTYTEVAENLSASKVDDTGVDLAGEARLIDLEVQEFVPPPPCGKNDYCEGGGAFLYLGAWLFAD
jgi:hypothetical protein